MGWIEGVLGGLEVLELGLLGKLALAALLGGLIGWEREASDKPAGLRTNLLICVGASLLAHVSIDFAGALGGPQVRADPARIAAQIVSGIGFLGAGTIIQARGSVTGLTTAATLWVVAAIGIAVGGGEYVAAVGSTILVLLALVPLGRLEDWLARRRAREATLRVSLSLRPGALERSENVLREQGVQPRAQRVQKELEEEHLVAFFVVRGRREALDRALRALVDEETVREVGLLEGTFD